jgi:hypothetical protein
VTKFVLLPIKYLFEFSLKVLKGVTALLSPIYDKESELVVLFLVVTVVGGARVIRFKNTSLEFGVEFTTHATYTLLAFLETAI